MSAFRPVDLTAGKSRRSPPARPRAKRKVKLIISALMVIIIIIGLAGGAEAMYRAAYQNKIFPGVRVANLNAGGWTVEQLRRAIQEQADHFNETGLTYQTANRTISLPANIVSTAADLDLAYTWVNIDVNATVKQAESFGRQGGWLTRWQQKINALVNGVVIPAAADVNTAKLRQALEQNFNHDLTAAQPVKVILDSDNNLDFTESSNGQRWDYDTALKQSEYLAQNLTAGTVKLIALADQPQVKRADLNNDLKNQVKNILNRAPLTLTYNDQSWTVAATELAGWLTFSKQTNKIIITLDNPIAGNYLLTNISPNIDRPAQEAKFSMTNNKVTEFQPTLDGQHLDIDTTINLLEQLLTNATDSLALTLPVITQPAPTNNNQGLAGITELVGVGRSNFAGSPVNRRWNIKIGATAVNGTIIQPDEEFSLLKTLGTVDAAAGYKPELVIKGNQTVPEFGGGLCQIGTTSFRAALAVGVPITERRNHSYRVTYYEPAGTDATIYNPAPDFKFINDYPTPLLFQTKIKGNELIFELWGTTDGRLATQTKPIISNLKAPAPKKIIETLDLKPGETKCTEKPHTGADTVFTYAVTYPSGEQKSTDFHSHYIPWQEVCLLGVTSLSSSSTSSTTPQAPPAN